MLCDYFFSEPTRPLPQTCDTDEDCPSTRDTKCNIMTSPISSGKKGYCVHRYCPQVTESKELCPKYGDKCSSGSLSGKCTVKSDDWDVCKYDSALVLGLGCGKETVFN